MEIKKTYKPYKNKETAPKAQYKPKRGKLAPLMSEEDKQEASIHELSYDLGCRITRLFQYLTEDSEYKEYVISKQIYRSGTSVGANGDNYEGGMINPSYSKLSRKMVDFEYVQKVLEDCRLYSDSKLEYLRT